MFMLHKMFIVVVIAVTMCALQAVPAFACGGLLAPVGDVRLARVTTLVAWHNGIERYFTSCTYQGKATNLGWIVPLPAVPVKVEEGGGWTLQRLFRETHPETFSLAPRAASSSAGTQDSAQVLQQVKVEALNITVLRGSAAEGLNWAAANGFFVEDEVRAHLIMHAKPSPISMAPKSITRAP